MAAAQDHPYTHQIGDEYVKVRIDSNYGGAITDLLILSGGVFRRRVVDNGDPTGSVGL